MELLNELKEVWKALLRVLACFMLFLCVFFAVPFQHTIYKGVPLLLPTTHGETLAARAVGRIEHDLLPPGATLIVTNPIESFSAEVLLAAEFAFGVTLPLLSFELWRFVSPGLYPRERRALSRFFVLSFFLVCSGAVFAYVIIIPRVFASLFTFLPGGVLPLYSLRQMVSLVSGITMASSVLFLLPVAMILLSALRLVQPSFWLTYARHAVLLSLIFSAILIPDPSGVSMVLLSVPMCILYFAGYLGSVLSARGRAITSKTTPYV